MGSPFLRRQYRSTLVGVLRFGATFVVGKRINVDLRRVVALIAINRMTVAVVALFTALIWWRTSDRLTELGVADDIAALIVTDIPRGTPVLAPLQEQPTTVV